MNDWNEHEGPEGLGKHEEEINDVEVDNEEGDGLVVLGEDDGPVGEGIKEGTGEGNGKEAGCNFGKVLLCCCEVGDGGCHEFVLDGNY